jgi:zinc protease
MKNLARFLKEGPTEEELQRVKAQYEANFIRGIERIGGFGGKSDRLAKSEVFRGSPDAYKVSLKHVREATSDELKAAANRWLSDGVYILEVDPFPDYKTAATGADRSKAPVPGTPPELKLPKLQRATLSNGLKIVLAERHEVPLVNFTLAADAGRPCATPFLCHRSGANRQDQGVIGGVEQGVPRDFGRTADWGRRAREDSG